jgi:RES domain-containing protein
MNLNRCGELPLIPQTGVWYRAIAPHHLPRPLETQQTTLQPSRYNPGPFATSLFAILYLSENPVDCMFEVDALFGSLTALVPNPLRALCILNVRVSLSGVVDLTGTGNQRILRTTAQELTGDWQQYPNADSPTQRLGAALSVVPGVEGFMCPSAVRAGQNNLVVLPQKLNPTSWVEYVDRKGKRIRIP